MRKEDAELEAMLREYNNEGRERKPQEMLDKPLDLPFYKGIKFKMVSSKRLLLYSSLEHTLKDPLEIRRLRGLADRCLHVTGPILSCLLFLSKSDRSQLRPRWWWPDDWSYLPYGG
jgi:hypothetical protein